MKLTRKHIGQLFNIEGSDGSWVYLLLDVSQTEFLFYSFSCGEHQYEIESRRHVDWRPYKGYDHTKQEIARAWETGRRS